MWRKLVQFVHDHNAAAHGFAAFVAFLGTLYATNADMRQYVDELLAGHPQIAAMVSILFIVYRNYASSHSKVALTRANDPKSTEVAK